MPNVDPANPKQTIEFIDGLLTAWKAQELIMADGKVNWTDLPIALSAAPVLWKGFVGIDVIDDEMLVVNDEGQEKIREKIGEFVFAGDPEAEELIEEIVELVLEIVRVAKKAVEHFK